MSQFEATPQKFTFTINHPQCRGKSFKILVNKVGSYNDLRSRVADKLINSYNINDNTFCIDKSNGDLVDDDDFDINNIDVYEFMVRFPKLTQNNNSNNNNSINNNNNNNNGGGSKNVFRNMYDYVRGNNNNNSNENQNKQSHIYRTSKEDQKMDDPIPSLNATLKEKNELFEQNMIKEAILDTNIENICYDMQVQQFITKLYPKFGVLWKYNPKSFLKFLESYQAIVYIKATKGLNIRSNDNNDKKCLDKYKNMLFDELNRLVPGELNNQLKHEAKQIFFSKHVAIQDEWPRSNSGPNERIIELKESRVYNNYIGDKDKVKYNVTWYMKGILNVFDQVQSSFRNTQYITGCKSESIEFKVLLLNENICININDQLSHGDMIQQTKQHLDSLESIETTQNESSALSWDDI